MGSIILKGVPLIISYLSSKDRSLLVTAAS
jgi:hypothetical protein